MRLNLPCRSNRLSQLAERIRSAPRFREGSTVFKSSARFGHDLLLDGDLEESRAVSPLSFQVVLSLLAAGSHGSTRRQFLNFFHTDSVDRLNSSASLLYDVMLADRDPAVGPRMRCSTALWLDQSLALKPSFKHILDSHYRAALNPVDFQTKAPHVREQINCWVENETSGLVKDLIRDGSLNNSVKLMFTNALYFKGAWNQNVETGPLSLEDIASENLVKTTFMVAKRKECGTLGAGVRLLNQQYIRQSEDKRSVSMSFGYPRTDPVYLTETLMEVNGRMTPKFDISSEAEASNVMRSLGITLPFSGGGLTEMLTCDDDGRELYVLNVFQKAFMEVNEQGTEAATATTTIVMSGCPPALAHVTSIAGSGHVPFLFVIETNKDRGLVLAKVQLLVDQVVSPLPR